MSALTAVPAAPPRPDNEQVAVVVVSHNSAADLPGLLASLDDGLAGVAWQLVVADNASADGSPELVRRCAPYATLVETGRNAGYAAGVNAAVRAAGPHAAVLVLNADVRLGSGAVWLLLDALRSRRTGIAVPRLTDAHGRLIPSMRREPTLPRMLASAIVGAERAGRSERWGEVVTDPAAYDRDRVTDWAEGSTQLVSRECWAACGPWDETFFLYSEETEFALRARDRGYVTTYVAAAQATHLEGGSAASAQLWPLLVVNGVRLYARRHGPLATAAFWAATLLREASRALLGRATSRAAVRTLLSPRRLRRPSGPEWLR